MTYSEAVDYILGIPRFTKKNDVKHTKSFLKYLGDPQRGHKVIHVAGTNGKGSVCAYLDSMLRSEGKRTGLFISPHLMKINERIRTDGVPVSDEAFLLAFLRVRDAVRKMERAGFSHPTFFEFLLGMAILGWFGAQGLVSLFRKDPEVIRYGTRSLRFQCISFPLIGWITMCNMMMQTIGKGFRASIMAMSRQGLFFIPLVIILSARMGFLGIQISQPISDGISFIMAIILQSSVLWEMNREAKKEGFQE